jgi:hypothetical protein
VDFSSVAGWHGPREGPRHDDPCPSRGMPPRTPPRSSARSAALREPRALFFVRVPRLDGRRALPFLRSPQRRATPRPLARSAYESRPLARAGVVDGPRGLRGRSRRPATRAPGGCCAGRGRCLDRHLPLEQRRVLVRGPGGVGRRGLRPRHAGLLQGRCVSYGAVESVLGDSPGCGTCPDCACLTSCHFDCNDDGMGGITLSDATCEPPPPPSPWTPPSQGGCYGSPPARPELRPRRS